MDADDLRWTRGVHGKDFAGGLDPFPADDDVVLAAQLFLDVGKRSLHSPLVFGLGEVNEWFVDELGLRRECRDGVGKIYGSHDGSILAREVDSRRP
jgi:hypothetical protein